MKTAATGSLCGSPQAEQQKEQQADLLLRPYRGKGKGHGIYRETDLNRNRNRGREISLEEAELTGDCQIIGDYTATVSEIIEEAKPFMTARQYQVCLTLFRTGSQVRTASELGITQPAISEIKARLNLILALAKKRVEERLISDLALWLFVDEIRHKRRMIYRPGITHGKKISKKSG